jgi:hypothetical protein
MQLYLECFKHQAHKINSQEAKAASEENLEDDCHILLRLGDSLTI